MGLLNDKRSLSFANRSASSLHRSTGSKGDPIWVSFVLPRPKIGAMDNLPILAGLAGRVINHEQPIGLEPCFAIRADHLYVATRRLRCKRRYKVGLKLAYVINRVTNTGIVRVVSEPTCFFCVIDVPLMVNRDDGPLFRTGNECQTQTNKQESTAYAPDHPAFVCRSHVSPFLL